MLTKVPDVNVGRLQAIAKSSPTAEIVMTNLALRERIRTFSDIKRLKMELIRSGERVVEADYNRMWQLLNAESFGTIEFAKNKPTKLSKFHWSYDFRILAKAAVGLLDSEEDKEAFAKFEASKGGSSSSNLTKKKVAKKVTKESDYDEDDAYVADKPVIKKPSFVERERVRTAAPANTAGRQIFIPLRSDFDLQFSLPSNITEEEVGYIISILKRSVSVKLPLGSK